jgi:hypothetical protein
MSDERLPEFEPLTTSDPQKAVKVLFNQAILAVPVLREAQIRDAYRRVQPSWGSQVLVEGPAEEVREIVLSNATSLARQPGFNTFEVGVLSGRGYEGEEAAQISALYEHVFAPIRVWRAESGYFACGNQQFKALPAKRKQAKSPPGTAEPSREIEVKNYLGFGDGTPLVVQEKPDLQAIFDDPDPKPPQRLTARNRDLWDKMDRAGIRRALTSAYLSHPHAKVRAATLQLAGDAADEQQLADLLVDRSTTVRSAAVDAIWDKSQGTAPGWSSLGFVLRILYDEYKQSGFVSHMSSAQALGAIRRLQTARPDRSEDFNKWLVDAWTRQEEPLSECGYRLLDLFASAGTFGEAAEQQARGIGGEIHELGGRPAMETLHEAIKLALGEEPAAELDAAWRGVGDWKKRQPRKKPTPSPRVEAVPKVRPEPPPKPAAPRAAPRPAVAPRRPPAPAAPIAEPKRNTLAVISLVAGIVSVLIFPCAGAGFPLGLAAVVIGLIGRKQISESDGAQSGSGMALGGMALGLVGVLAGFAGCIILYISQAS